MKPTRTLLCSAIFFSMGSQLLPAAGDLTIGGSTNNITPAQPFSPVNFTLDATLSEFSIVGALGTDPSVVVTTTGNPAGGKITVNSPIAWLNGNALTLDANTGLTVSAAITNAAGGTLNLKSLQAGVALNGVVELTGAGTSSLSVQAAAGITQDNLHVLTVDGLATLDAATSNIILTSQTNHFGSLKLTGGSVTLREAGSTNLTGVNAATLDLTSSGAITAPGSLQVAGAASFNAGADSIDLSNAANNFGSLNLTGGALTVTEAGNTDLGTVNGASLVLDSGGAISNSGNVSVSGSAQVSGASIDLGGSAGSVSVGSIQFNSPGNVTLKLVSGTSITGANTAGTFAWDTDGVATLAAGATIDATAIEIRKSSLVLSASNQLTAGSLTVNSGTSLDLGGFNDTVGNYFQNGSGILAGSGTLTAATYNLNGGTVNARLGTGILNHTGNTTLLNGTAGATAVNLSGGTLILGAANRLSDFAAVSVGPGSLNLGAFNEAVGTFALNSGTLDGSGTLTALTYNLNGGTVNANLGGGTLSQTGSATLLVGAAGASTVNVNGGTLTLGAAGRLSDNATLKVGPGTLNLAAFDETVGTFTLNAGILASTGTLTASAYDLNGGAVNANLGQGPLNQLSNTTTLAGTSASVAVNVSGGTLALGASNRLADSSAVVVAAGTLDLGAFSETAGTFTLNAGTLAGTGTLSASSYDLNGGSIDANLGEGAFTQISNTTTLSGAAASAAVNINGGTLALGASERLNDSSLVTIASAGTLDLGVSNETVGALRLDNGIVDGTGTLTASDYFLNGGTVNANLGAGNLLQTSNTTTLNGSSAAARVNIDGGTLVLGGSHRLADSSEVMLASGTTLDVGGFVDTVGSFQQASGSILAGSGTLTATHYRLEGGRLDANLGTGTMDQIRNTTALNGSSKAASVNIYGGVLALGASNRLADDATVSVGAAGLDLGAFSDTIRTFSLARGTLSGTGVLTAKTYTLSGGVVNARLGSGTLQQLASTTRLTGTSNAADVRVRGGFLSLGASDRLADNAVLRVVETGTLKMGSSDETVKTYRQSGGGRLSGSGELVVTGRATLKGGRIAGNLTGDTKISGTVTVTGTLGGGYLSVSSGNLILNGTAEANAKIRSGATLQGIGTVDGSVRNYGNLAVGAQGRTLKITGSLVTQGVVSINVKSAGKFEKIKADSVAFGGNLVVVNTGKGLARGEKVQLFDADSYSGDFKSFTPIGFDSGVVFDEKTGRLIGVGGSKSPSSGRTPAPAASPSTASATPARSAPMARSVAASAPAPAAPAPPAAIIIPPVIIDPDVINRLSPEVHRGMADYSEQALRAHAREAIDAAPISRQGKTQVFATLHTTSAGVDGSTSNAGYDTDIQGATAGARYEINGNAMIGGFFGVDDGEIKGELIDTDAKGLVLGAFGCYLLEPASQTKLVSSISYGSFQYDAARSALGGMAAADDIDSDALELTLGVSGVVYEKSGLRISPYATLRYLTGDVDGFRESGSGTDLIVDSQDIDSTLLDVGVDFDYQLGRGFSLAARLGYIHDFDGFEKSVSARFTTANPGGLPFAVDAPGIDNEAFTLGIAAFYDINDTVRVGLTYRGELRTDSQSSHSIGLGTSFGF